MADIVKNISSVQLVAAFADGDDRTLSIDSPKAAIDAAAVNDLSDYIKEHNILLGDKEGANFTKIKTARIINGTTTYFDLTD